MSIAKELPGGVIPFDKNEVISNPSKDFRPSARGYLNARFIMNASSESVSWFIAMQGPLPHTLEDFWEMVVQNHSPAVVMLTQLVDNYKVGNHPFYLDFYAYSR